MINQAEQMKKMTAVKKTEDSAKVVTWTMTIRPRDVAARAQKLTSDHDT